MRYLFAMCKRVRNGVKRKGIGQTGWERWIVESTYTLVGGLGSVATTGLRNVSFRICGNGWTYGRILGCVARKGVREEEVRK
jgi:hypothetical protein